MTPSAARPRPTVVPTPDTAAASEVPAASDVQAAPDAPTASGSAYEGRSRGGPLHELDRPGDLFRHLGPNWFTCVMGTGIVGNAAATLPGGVDAVPGVRTAATLVWALAASLLLVLSAAWVAHFTRHRAHATAHADHPVTAHFWGAPAMALITVGAGALLLGQDWMGLGPALVVNAVLWSAGTLLGLVTCVWIPFRVMTRHDVAADAAFGGWLVPVVPPMVSATTGAALLPHLPAGQGRLTLLLGCYAMFGVSLLASLLILTQVWSRLVHHRVGPAATVPTLWIVLGPLGQSVTAAHVLGASAHLALPAPYAHAADAFGFLYGVPVWGFAMMWLALAASVTVRTARRHLPFSLSWWSFTFPLGTCVTGTSALAVRLDAALFQVSAFVLYALLVAAWLLVGARTLRGAVSGRLFLPPDGVPLRR